MVEWPRSCQYAIRHFAEVGHVRTEQDGGTDARRFQWVLSAIRSQGFSNKGHGAQAVKKTKLANRIGNVDARFRGRGVAGGTQADGNVGFAAQRPANGRSPSRMPGNNDG